MASKKPTKAKTKKRNTSNKKTNTNRKNTTNKGNVAVDSEVMIDIILCGVVAVCILLFLSNLGLGGIIGNGISGFFFGLFGFIAYLFPVILLIGTFFMISNRTNTIAWIKNVFIILLVCFLCCFVELLCHGADTKGAIEAYIYSSEYKTGGGFIGGLLAKILCSGFGVIGAYVVTIVLMMVSILLITEKSAFRGIQKRADENRKKAHIKKLEDRKIREAQRERERLERKRKISENKKQQAEALEGNTNVPRRERKVSGIAYDTTIAPEIVETDKPTDEVSEVKINIFNEDVEIADLNRILLTSSQEEQRLTSNSKEQRLASSAKEQQAEQKSQQPETKTEAVVAPNIKGMMQETAKAASMPTNVNTKESVQKPVKAPASMAPKEETAVPKEDAQIASQIAQATEKPVEEYQFPSIDLLTKVKAKANGNTKEHLMETAEKLRQTLKNFGVNVTVTDVSCGPAVTRYEIQPEMGVKVSKIVNLADDIKLNLAAADIRIEAPIPGKAAVGIEVPNKENVMVSFRELMESKEFKESKSNIAFAAGRDIAGDVVISNIAKMPHLLIAGATGSGKSVCINTIIMSILYKAHPNDVKFIMIDPKVVELSVYNGIPHLLVPVVTDPKKAAGALHWAVEEMTDRYNKFAQAGVRDMAGYNSKIVDGKITLTVDGKTEEVATPKMPQIIVIVDELADLMMVASNEVEESICRLAQLARAAGIHLIIATQRPSVNVITGLIKANMPSRIAFSVTSGVDSRTILDMNGAEKLLGKGDMLYYPQGLTKPLRVQGAFVSDDEVQRVSNFLKKQNQGATYDTTIEEKMKVAETTGTPIGGDVGATDERDLYFEEAARLIIDKEKGSIGMLQRYFKIGFNRAARIMDQLEEAGVVGPEVGTKPRSVLMSIDEFEQMV